jgi:hypothetical protein
MIRCDLLPIKSIETPGKLRFGRYHGSCFWDIANFGSKKWVVGAYINLENQKLFEEEFSVEDLARNCVEYLNQPPPRKKYAKREPKPIYGRLEVYKAKIIEKGDRKYISALLVVDSNRNKLFWGKGKNV